MELFQEISQCQSKKTPASLSKSVERLTNEIQNIHEATHNVNKEHNTACVRTYHLNLPTDKGEDHMNTIVLIAIIYTNQTFRRLLK